MNAIVAAAILPMPSNATSAHSSARSTANTPQLTTVLRASSVAAWRENKRRRSPSPAPETSSLSALSASAGTGSPRPSSWSANKARRFSLGMGEQDTAA